MLFFSTPLRALAFVARALGMAAWVMAGGWVASGARRASIACLTAAGVRVVWRERSGRGGPEQRIYIALALIDF
jgi:hypothetical protein